MKSKSKSDVVVEQYTMETLYPGGVYHSAYHFGADEQAMIEVTRKNSMRELVDIQVIDRETCMVLRYETSRSQSY